MAFQISPGINVSEINLTNIVPAVATTEGAIAGVFNWGPLNTRVLVASESQLATQFGTPNNNNAETFFTAADFLAYTNALYVVRAASSNTYNAGTSNAQISTDIAALANSDSAIIARYPGSLGNSLKISVCPNSTAYSSTINGIQMTVGSNTATVTDYAALTVGDILRVGTNSIGFQNLVVTNASSTTVQFSTKLSLSSNISSQTSTTGTRYWGQYKNVNSAPATGSIHVAVIDNDGKISGTAGTVLEVWQNLSTDPSAKNADGSTNYYKSVINARSAWIFATSTNIQTTVLVPAPTANSYTVLTNGTDGNSESTISLADLAKAYDKFKSTNEVNISLIMQGKAIAGSNETGLANYIIDNIASVRRDCVAFISPAYDQVVNVPGSEVDNILAFQSSLSPSTYAVVDTGYKYRYDKYNDVYRYTPLNGDIAGLAARTDQTNDPWWSPAGYNRGIIKNVVKLAFNPTKSQRDILYSAYINPVIAEQGQGALLFGDKTFAGTASAFDRINVRRLFIVLEKAISLAAKSTLFEFNDSFTRSQFKNLVEPYLRDIQGRRGIYDYKVVCDDTNNTAQVIDSNQFVGDIYVKPARSINYIQLNFVAVRSGVQFDEIVGKF
jgi:hypothetical protein